MLLNDMDQTLFKKVLQSELGHENFIINEVQQHATSSKAEHGLSDIYRIYLRFIEDGKETENNKGRVISLIVKKEPNLEGAGLDLIRKQGLFATETTFLCDVLPRLEKRLGFSLGPKMFYSNENSNLIVMEDLNAKGYLLQDRQKGLSMQYTLMTIDRLAKFHAASVSLFENKPELIRGFKSGIMSRETHENMYKIVVSSLLMLSNSIIEKWTDQEAVAAAYKLKKMADNFENRISKVYDYEEDEFCVLNHGDCWHSNLLFKTDERGFPIDMLMVDYQMTVFSSPAIDLLYFLGICPAIDIKCEMDDYFLEIYLRTLKVTMQKIHCKTKAPSMDQLKKAIYKRKIYAVFSSLVFYPRMIADESETETFDDTLVTGKTKMDVFKNPDAITAVQKIIKVMNQRGYFD